MFHVCRLSREMFFEGGVCVCGGLVFFAVEYGSACAFSVVYGFLSARVC